MNIIKQAVFIFLGIFSVCLMLAPHAASAAIAGQVQFVNGRVEVTTNGQTRILRKGEQIAEGDEIATAAGSYAQIKMQDGGFVAIRPNTQMKIDKFVFNGTQDGNERSYFSLFKGGFRAVTGLIGSTNKRNYRISTPTATIGIRGTDHESFVVLDGDAATPAGTYSKVNVGETTLSTHSGTVNVLPNQMGYASSQDASPILAPVNTNIFTVAAAPDKTLPENGWDGVAMADAGRQSEASGRNGATTQGKAARAQVLLHTMPPSGVVLFRPLMDAPLIALPVVLVNQGTGAVLNLNDPILPRGGSTPNPATPPAPSPATPPAPSPAPPPAPNPATVVTAPVTNPYAVTSLLLADDLAFSRFSQPFVFETLPSSIVPSAATPSFTMDVVGVCSAPPCSTGAIFTLPGATGAVTGAATSVSSTGIRFGRYATVPTLTTTTLYAAAPSTTVSQTFSGGYGSWISGPGVNPFYLPEALVGTATYVLDGGTTPVTQSGVAGTLDSASLSVNFTNQTVGANLAVSGGGHSWTATATGMPLTSNRGVGSARSYFDTLGDGTISVVMDGATIGQGYIVGQLTGNAVNGAFLQYYFSGLTTQSISGAAAFKLDTFNGAPATTVNQATPYQLVAISRYDALGLSRNGTANFNLNMAFDNSGRVHRDAAGNLTSFDMAPNTGISVVRGASPSANSNVISIGTATAVDQGSDPVSGIVWGRWQGGNLAVTDRVTNSPLAAISNTTSSLHWLSSPVMTGPVTLPASGTYNYTLGGGTSPTDNLGNTGTLNSASLQADFSAMTVNVGVNATVSGVNYVGVGSNLPIQQTAFGDGNGGTYTATANGTAIQGGVGGSFTGQGAAGAGVVYAFQDGTTVVKVNGVLAFHR